MNSSLIKTICVLSSVHEAIDVRIFHKECKTLASAGYQVTLIAPHNKQETIDGVRIIPLEKPKNRFIRMFWSSWKILFLAIRQKADVYHFHDPELLPVGLFLKLFTMGKVIYDVHEDVPEQILSKSYIPVFLRRPVAAIFNRAEKVISGTFDHVFCTTDVIAGNFLLCNPKTSIVRNYISKSYAYNNIGKCDHPRNGYVMIFAGSIYHERGIIEAVQALNILSDMKITFLLFGNILPDFYKRIVEEDERGCVIYRGILPFEDVLIETANADIGYICDYPLKRHMEGLPIKLFEYMATGVAVIASAFPIWMDIVNKANCGLTVDPLNSEDIARSIRYLIENEDVRRRMGENGRRAIIERYNWETEAQTLLNAYRNMEESY